MRTTLLPFCVIILATAVLLGLLPSDAGAGDSNQPGPFEVIIHGDEYFGPGLAKHFRLGPTMRQYVLYLDGSLLDRNFQSVQVGSKVIASLYRARPGRADAGYDRLLLPRSATRLPRIYSILVINRKSDSKDPKNYFDLPFRVRLTAQWSGGISGGHLDNEEYFVARSSKGLREHDLSPGLVSHGADDIVMFAGRYDPGSVEVMLFDQPHCQGTNARTFPVPPSKAISYKLRDYGFGDKARSLRITWKGPEFDAPGGVGMPPPVPAAVPDLKGVWQNQLGQRYVIGTNGQKFAWKFPTLNETGEGRFLDPIHVEVRWTDASGGKHGPIKGTVQNTGQGMTTRITFVNGLVLTHVGATPPPPVPAVNLSGAWKSNYGQVDFKQQGGTLTGTIHYPNGVVGSLQGTIQGNTIDLTWSVNPQVHGHGTLTIAPSGKQLEGSVVDDISKAKAHWVLTR
ncbi:MAG: hypothetical protein ACC662_07875 [Planctomycetota bacterium]